MLLGSDLAALMRDIFIVTFTMLDFCRGNTNQAVVCGSMTTA